MIRSKKIFRRKKILVKFGRLALRGVKLDR